MSGTRLAPWEIHEVQRAFRWQASEAFHPYTCSNHADAAHPAAAVLVPTVRGWICPYCDYTQDWAHDFTLEQEPPKTAKPEDWMEIGEQFAEEVNRLWPEEDHDAYRAQCLAEEAGEVSRAITKRRHAHYSSDGTCKGLTEAEWTDELRTELAQAVGVCLDIASREGFDIDADVRNCLAILKRREPGT